jgi:two-component system, NtrC family, sensor kinase
MKVSSLLRTLLVAAVTILLIAGLAFLYSRSSSVDAEKKTRIEGYLRQLKQVDAEWNVDVLKSRTEINKNYDPLTTPLAVLASLQKTLAQEAKTLGRFEPEEAVGQLQGVIAEKTDLVDQFKAQNAILKNSLRYMPTAVDELQAEIRRAKRPGVATDTLDILNARTSQLLNDVLKYNLLPDSAAAQNIEASLLLIDASESLYPKDVAASARNVLRHTRTILRQRVVEDDVLTKIAAMPMSTAVDRVGEVFDGNFQVELAESDRYRDYLLAYSTFLLALLVYIGARLLRSYRIIGRVNKDLKHANETLEQRVRERTDELSKALHDLKESETQLVQSEKMASLGQMVAGVAHEINTPLAYVRSSLETVESRVTETVREFVDATLALVGTMRSGDASDDEVADKFGAAAELADHMTDFSVIAEIGGLLRDGVHGVDEITKIVMNLKNFSRLDRGLVAKQSVDACVEDTLKLARSIIKGRKVTKILGHTTPIRCAPSQINQVLLNLITNAAQASPAENGEITVVTRMRGAEHVAVEVIDNGSGIPKDVLPRIFDPFFTTKAVGKGTGLGLAIVYKIVELHGGRIVVHSKEGAGAKFTVVLPVAGAEPDSAEPDSAATEVSPSERLGIAA